MDHYACWGRPATERDIDAISAIYQEIHAAEAEGKACAGWQAGVYPVRATAEAALRRGDLFALTDGDTVVGAAIINHVQMPAYAQIHWTRDAKEEEVMVLHTLVISPRLARRGYGTAAVAFYEDWARKNGCLCLRMDTNIHNVTARALYRKLGYREMEVVDCPFNGIASIPLLMLEKTLEG